MPPLLVDAVPANLRHHQLASKPAHSATQQSEPRRRSKFLRLVKQQLHANTNAQQRRSCLHSLAHQTIEAPFTQSLHTRAKRADTRQH